jgi:hypothetical protein
MKTAGTSVISHPVRCLFLQVAVAVAVVMCAVPATAATMRGVISSPSLLNGSFESSGFAGWSTAGGSALCPWTTVRAYTTATVCHAGYGFQEPAPATGLNFATTDFDRTPAAPANAILSQKVTIPATTRTTLRWSDFISWDLATFSARQARVATVEIRDATGTKVLRTLSTQTLLPGTASFNTAAWTNHTVDVSDFAGCNVTLAFHLFMPEVATGPATYSVDAISIESSRTSTPPHSTRAC